MDSQNAKWDFFTNHAQVLFYLQAHPDRTLRQASLEIGITERAVQRIVADLEEAKCLTRKKVGRQNQYTIETRAPLRHPMQHERSIQDLLDAVGAPEEDSVEEYQALENWTVGEHGSEI